jgi:hypothetical protein
MTPRLRLKSFGSWPQGTDIQDDRRPLRGFGVVIGATSHVKGGVYVSRVLGTRAGRSAQVDTETAVELARQIYLADSWRLDAVL